MSVSSVSATSSELTASVRYHLNLRSRQELPHASRQADDLHDRSPACAHMWSPNSVRLPQGSGRGRGEYMRPLPASSTQILTPSTAPQPPAQALQILRRNPQGGAAARPPRPDFSARAEYPRRLSFRHRQPHLPPHQPHPEAAGGVPAAARVCRDCDPVSDRAPWQGADSGGAARREHGGRGRRVHHAFIAMGHDDADAR